MSFSGSCAMWSVPRSRGELIHWGVSQPVTTTELSLLCHPASISGASWPVRGTRADAHSEQGLASVIVVTVYCPRRSDQSAQGGESFLWQGHPQ